MEYLKLFIIKLRTNKLDRLIYIYILMYYIWKINKNIYNNLNKLIHNSIKFN